MEQRVDKMEVHSKGEIMKLPIKVRQTIQGYETEDAVITAALALLARRMSTKGASLNSPSSVRDYLRLTLAGLEYEVFWMISLDAQNRVIAAREMFRGTLTQTSVFPREVVKQALSDNAGGVILAHNHPSGVTDPSHADETLTKNLKEALAMVDVRVLDHFIIAGANWISFAERGLI